MQSVGFIGGGRVTRILLRGWAHAASLPSSMVIAEPDDAAFAALGPGARREHRGSLEAACACDVVFLALHPPHAGPVLPAIRPALRRESVLVSLAPKITMADITAACGSSRVARVIPNAPSIIGRGFNPVAFAPGLPAEARERLTALFAPLGQFPEVPEGELEAYAVLTGMGPTYLWPQFQALREVAAECGLAPEATDRALRAMVGGTVATLLDAGIAPAAVMDLVPVKPLAEQEPGLVAAYRTLLPALHRKITPAKTAGATR